MTVVDEAPHLCDEEVLPLVQSLQLDRPGRQHRHPLLKRIRLQLRSISPELIAIALVYFVQGILKLSTLAITFFEKDDLHMEPTQMAIADTISGLPWTVKPLYGFITDSFPIRGMRRRPYLILAGLVGTTSWLCLSLFASSIPTTIACITAAAAATAFSDVVADSLVVELARAAPGSTEGALQSLCWGAHAVGRVITAYLSGWMVDKAGARFVFLITSTFPLVVCLSSCLISEQKLAAAAAAAAAGQDGDTAAAGEKTNGKHNGSSSAKDVAAHGGSSSSSMSKSAAAAAGGGEAFVLLGSSSGHKEILPATPLGAAGSIPAVLGHHQGTGSSSSSYHGSYAAAKAGVSAFEVQQQQHDGGVQSKVSGLHFHQLQRRSSYGHDSSSPSGSPRFRSSTIAQADADSSSREDAAGSKLKAGPGVRQCLHQALGGVMKSVWLFWNAVKQPHVLRPVVFMFFWQGMPTAGTAMFYFKTNKLHFDAEFLGRVKLVVALADLLGIAVYNSFLKAVRLRRLMLWGSFLGCGLGLTPLLLVEGVNRRLGISDKAFALVDSALLSSIGQVLMMPTLVLAARLCPVGVEGTLYASIMSTFNMSAGLSELLGAVLMKLFGITSSNFSHLSALLLTCNLLSLLPLPLIGWVPDETAADAAAAAAADAEQQDSDKYKQRLAAAAAGGDIGGDVGVIVGDGLAGGLSAARASLRTGSTSGTITGGRQYLRVPDIEGPDWGEKHS